MQATDSTSEAEDDRSLRDSQFAALVHSVVHDLRSPLVTMESMASLLRDSAQKRLEKDELGYLDHIESGARTMRELLADLSEYTLIRTTSSRLETVDTKELFTRIVREQASEISSQGAQIVLTGDLPIVQGEVSVLEHVFRQLLENSLKFRRPGVPVRVEFSCTEEASGHQFVVKDNGIGVPAQYHEKVFGVLTRLHPRARYGGSGIGLAIVRRCVESLGGSVSLDSRDGEGTAVRFTIPSKR